MLEFALNADMTTSQTKKTREAVRAHVVAEQETTFKPDTGKADLILANVRSFSLLGLHPERDAAIAVAVTTHLRLGN